ncbi:MAG: tetratricopeptide repeat protein, partial [Kiloniellales bacterium]
FGLAVNHFQSAVRREPDSIEALNGLAATYDRLGRYDLSARYYQRALAADPESTQTLNNIGYSYLLQERFDLAVAYLRDAQSRDRKDPVVLANRKTAEVSYQEADLKRSAEEARTKRFAAAASTPSRPRLAQPPVSPVQVASNRRVKPWIERTAPRVQTLVTQPQLALIGAVEEVGIDPQLAAYRPQQPLAAELLPDHAVAPMTLDARPSPEPGEAVRQEVRSAPTAPAGPRAPDQPRSVPVTGLAPAEVTVASLDRLPALVGVAAEDPGGVDGVLAAGPVAGSAPIEAIVASLDPARDLSDVAPGQGQPASVATTELIAPEVALSDLDPLDALEDGELAAENGSPQEAAGMAPAEVEVAKLSTVVPGAPRVDAGPAVAISAILPLVEVSNGTGRLDMAARIRDHLEAKGIVVKRLTNAEHYRHQETIIFYRSGWRAYAEVLARMLPAVVDLDGRDGQESDVRLELGGDLLEFDRGLYYAVKRSDGANPG